MQLRKFNDAGIAAFAAALDGRPGTHGEASQFYARLESIRTSNDFSSSVGPDVTFTRAVNRRELAEQLWDVLGSKGPVWAHASDLGVWAWLSAALLPLYVSDSKSYAQIGSNYRWIPEPTTLRNHRHLFQGPYMAFAAHASNPDDAMAALATDVLSPGELAERICGKADFMESVAMVVATRLYFDPKTGKLKAGSSTRGDGSAQNLSIFLNQLSMTVDFQDMAADEIIAILPSEFSRWL